MKSKEKGYSLIVVLFAIVIITTLGLSLFTLNINNAKQINLTKEELVATDLAEMGIIYYETLFTEHSFTFLNNAIQKVENQIINENTGKKEKDKIAINTQNILSRLDKDIPLNSNIKIGKNVLENSPAENFKITFHKNSPFDTINNIFTVVFISESFTKSHQTAKLTGTITINYIKYINDYLNNKNSGSRIEQLKNIRNMCSPNNFSSLNNCKIDNVGSISNNSSHKNKIGLIDNAFIIPNKVTITNSTLYITGNISTGNNPNFYNSVIYSEGKGDFGNGGLNKTTLYLKDGATFHNFTKFTDNSIIYSENDITIKNITGNSNVSDSKIITKGKLSIEKINSPITNSVICAGSLAGEIANYKESSTQIYLEKFYPDYFKDGGICSISFDKRDLSPTDFLNNLDVDYN